MDTWFPIRMSITISGVCVPLYMIGDSAYPIQLWLMKPFTYNSDLTTYQRTIITGYAEPENAFGQLKA